MTRRLTVLGTCAAFPTAGRACSGFLIEWDGYRLVLDLGYATLPRLLTHCPDGVVDAVVVTHEHPDHCIDLHGLFRFHYYGSSRRAKIPLYCPPGVLDRLCGIEPNIDIKNVFEPHELPGAIPYRVGPFILTSELLPHFVHNAGVRLSVDVGLSPGDTAEKCVLAYTGDTGPDPRLENLGQNAPLYIVEATDREGEIQRPSRNLMTSEEAGYWAARARSGKLMLTHFWPNNDREAAAAKAKLHFKGEVLIAEEGLQVELTTRSRSEALELR